MKALEIKIKLPEDDDGHVERAFDAFMMVLSEGGSETACTLLLTMCEVWLTVSDAMETRQ